jgi:hypothetical protein
MISGVLAFAMCTSFQGDAELGLRPKPRAPRVDEKLGLCPKPRQRNFLEKVSLESSKTLKHGFKENLKSVQNLI